MEVSEKTHVRSPNPVRLGNRRTGQNWTSEAATEKAWSVKERKTRERQERKSRKRTKEVGLKRNDFLRRLDPNCDGQTARAENESTFRFATVLYDWQDKFDEFFESMEFCICSSHIRTEIA